MKVAIIGSRTISGIDLGKYLPPKTTQIISGGAKGVDQCAKEYAISNNIPLKEILPVYKRYGCAAPLKRNIQIVDESDVVLAFWDNRSHGTKFVIDYCTKTHKEVKVFVM